MKRNNSANMAIGGVFAALAVVVMSMGTLIPVATYVCPVICMLFLQTVLRICGIRTAWAWYFAVSTLSLLMAPDKEAAIVFLFLGYYPIVKSWMDRQKGKWFLKAIFFNLSVLTAYRLMLRILGLDQVAKDLENTGLGLAALLLILGNITFFLVDRLLTMGIQKLRRR